MMDYNIFNMDVVARKLHISEHVQRGNAEDPYDQHNLSKILSLALEL